MIPPRERWTLALLPFEANEAIETWLQVDMPLTLRLARANERGFCCLIAEVSYDECEAIRFLSEIVRRTECRVHRQPI